MVEKGFLILKNGGFRGVGSGVGKTEEAEVFDGISPGLGLEVLGAFAPIELTAGPVSESAQSERQGRSGGWDTDTGS